MLPDAFSSVRSVVCLAFYHCRNDQLYGALVTCVSLEVYQELRDTLKVLECMSVREYAISQSQYDERFAQLVELHKQIADKLPGIPDTGSDVSHFVLEELCRILELLDQRVKILQK